MLTYLKSNLVGQNFGLSILVISITSLINYRYHLTKNVPKSLYLASVSGLVLGILYLISWFVCVFGYVPYFMKSISFRRVRVLMNVITGTKYGKLLMYLYLWVLSLWSATCKDRVTQTYGIILFVVSVVWLWVDLKLDGMFLREVYIVMGEAFPNEEYLNYLVSLNQFKLFVGGHTKGKTDDTFRQNTIQFINNLNNDLGELRVKGSITNYDDAVEICSSLLKIFLINFDNNLKNIYGYMIPSIQDRLKSLITDFEIDTNSPKRESLITLV